MYVLLYYIIFINVVVIKHNGFYNLERVNIINFGSALKINLLLLFHYYLN